MQYGLMSYDLTCNEFELKRLPPQSQASAAVSPELRPSADQDRQSDERRQLAAEA